MTAEAQIQCPTAALFPTPLTTRPRVLVIGSSDWVDADLIDRALDATLTLLRVPVPAQDAVTLLHGADDLDTLAAQVAGGRGWKLEAHPAGWGEMNTLGVDLVIAFPMVGEAAGPSQGTWGRARAAMLAGLATVVLWENSFHPWGPKAEQLVVAEHTLSMKEPARHPGGPVPLETLRPIPF